MGFKEVTLTEEETKALASGGNFWTPKAIGNKIAGRFISVTQRQNPFGKTDNNYTFKVLKEDGKTPEEVVFTAPQDAHAKLKKAALKPGDGVRITYIANGEIYAEGKPPAKLFRVEVSDSPAPAATTPPPAPKPAEEPNDILF